MLGLLAIMSISDMIFIAAGLFLHHEITSYWQFRCPGDMGGSLAPPGYGRLPIQESSTLFVT